MSDLKDEMLSEPEKTFLGKVLNRALENFRLYTIHFPDSPQGNNSAEKAERLEKIMNKLNISEDI